MHACMCTRTRVSTTQSTTWVSVHVCMHMRRVMVGRAIVCSPSHACTHAHAEGSRLSGVMVGRAIVSKPWEWATLDTALYGEMSDPAQSRHQVLSDYCDYARTFEAQTPQKIRHLLIKPGHEPGAMCACPCMPMHAMDATEDPPPPHQARCHGKPWMGRCRALQSREPANLSTKRGHGQIWVDDIPPDGWAPHGPHNVWYRGPESN